jgi:uncharacterized membrane protein
MTAGLAVGALVYRWRFTVQSWAEHRSQSPWVRRGPQIALGCLVAAYFLVFCTLSLLKHFNFYSRYDLAAHAQAMWNTSQGRWFETTLLAEGPKNYLSHHFSPALLLLLPVYGLWPDTATLLILQTMLLALGVIPVYLCARRRTGSQLVALTLSLAYLLFPAVEYVNLADFHEIALAVPLLSLTAYWLLTERYRLFIVFLALSLLVKEEMALIALAFGVYLLLVHRRYRLGVFTLLLGVGYFSLVMGVLMPAIGGGDPFPFDGYRYQYLGDSFGQVIRTALLNPLLVLEHLLVPAKLQFLLCLLVPLGLLPLLGFETMILALPTLLYLLVSDYGPHYDIQYFYTPPLIPLLFMASVTAIERLIRWKGRPVVFAVCSLLLATSLAGYVLVGPGPLARHFNEHGQYNLWPHLTSGYKALASIPADASVMTPVEFAPRLAAREQIYLENPNYLRTEYVMQEYTARESDPRYPALVPASDELVYHLFETVFDQDGYWVRQYEASVPISNRLGISFSDGITLLAYQWRRPSGVLEPILEPGAHLDLVVAWRVEQVLPERYAFFVHLLDKDSHRWAQVDQEVERGVYRTTLWEPGMVVADHYRLSVPWGTPPSEYQVLMGAYSKETGQRLRPENTGVTVRDNAILLATIKVIRPTCAPPLEELAAQHRLEITFNDEIELVGFNLGQDSAQPGQRVPLILIWRALSKPNEDYLVSLRLTPINGGQEQSWSGRPAGGSYPTIKWEQDEIVRDWHDLGLAPDIAPGVYELSVGLVKPDGGAVRSEVSLGTVAVEGRKRVFTAPQIQTPLEARLGDSVAFLGYDQSSTAVRPGETIYLTLYWQALREMDVSYTVFTHLLDSEERIWGQMDSIPARGQAPTTSWAKGEIITDEYEIAMDPEVAAGVHVIEIGMYDPSSGQRLSVYDLQGERQGDRIPLVATLVLVAE